MGAADFQVASLKALHEADPGVICPLLEKRLLERARVLPGAVLAGRALSCLALEAGVKAAVCVESPVLALALAIDLFYPKPIYEPGIHSTAVVHPSATVHPAAQIGPNAVIEGDAEVGEGTVVGAGAVVMAGCKVGKHAVIGPGAVIGFDGFGFAPGPEGPVKVRHVGSVVIEDYVEIGANTCIDRGTLGATVVGRCSKLDNLVQVGHNAVVGERVLVAGQAGLAGSTMVGDDAMLGGQAGVADRVSIGKKARVAAASGVTRDVKDGRIVAGYPALPRRQWQRAMAWLARAGRPGGEEDGD